MLRFLIFISFVSPLICQTTPPNILFILADDLGWNDVSWNNPEVHMPNLDNLARQGLILNNSYVQPTCGPSRSALMTGYYPSRLGMQFVPVNDLEPVGLSTKFKLLPEYLKTLGYSTHAAGKWHLGYCNTEYHPTSRGFDSFQGLWTGAGDHYQHITIVDPNTPTTIGYDYHEGEKVDLGVFNTETSTVISNRISSLLAERIEPGRSSSMHLNNYNTSNPFFIYAAFQDVHTPLQIEKEYEDLYPKEEDPARKKLLGMVSRLDAAVGRIVSDLENISYNKDGESRTLLQDTVIIFSSDNGGMSQGLGYGGASNYPLNGRKGDIYEGGCRVPGFIYNSGAQGVTDQLFHITDWLPTIFAGLAGGDESALPADINGFNQIDLISNQTGVSPRDEILYDIANFQSTNHTIYVNSNFPANFELGGSFGAGIRYKDWKLLVGCSTVIGCARNYNETYGGNTSNQRELLYNLVDDPSESQDLSSDPQYSGILEELKVRLEYHLDAAVPPLHLPQDPAGLPSHHFPPGQLHAGWCEPIYEPFH